TTTGMISPSSFEVFALKFLQKSMILTPCGPSAVPTGGAGVAFPAEIWSFTIACTFFAMYVWAHCQFLVSSFQFPVRNDVLETEDWKLETTIFPPAKSPIPPVSIARR